MGKRNGTAYNGTTPLHVGTMEVVPESVPSSSELGVLEVQRPLEESQRTSSERTRSLSPVFNRPGNISPSYDNLTLDEILEASCKWVEYFEGHSSSLSGEFCALCRSV